MELQQNLDELEPFIDDGETSIDGYAASQEIGVLTDRQLLSLELRGRDETTTVVNSTYLDRIGGVKIEHKTTPDFQQDKLLSGIVSLFIALVSFVFFGTVDSSGPEAVLLLVGSCVGLLGLVLLFEAYNTPDGSVSIQLQTSEGDVAWQSRLDEDHREFAETLSRTVSNSHEPVLA